MTPHVETQDKRSLPPEPASAPGTDEPSPGMALPEAALGAMFGIACRKSGPGDWDPPSPEELQADFPDHEIRSLLGRGGMGAVYKGWHRSLNRFVAIKILPPTADDGISDFAERFKREANAMAQLRHGGIVSVYGAGETSGGLLYFVMECVDGTDVQRLVKERGPLESSEALRITVAVCEALACAHARGIIHRDIKPSNIILGESGAVKVADFGLAKCTAPGTASLTMTNVAMGTPEFMAPEALTDAAKVDHRADIYAVGVMLYYMLTGKIPLPGYVLPSRAVPRPRQAARPHSCPHAPARSRGPLRQRDRAAGCHRADPRAHGREARDDGRHRQQPAENDGHFQRRRNPRPRDPRRGDPLAARRKHPPGAAGCRGRTRVWQLPLPPRKGASLVDGGRGASQGHGRKSRHHQQCRRARCF